MATRDMKRGRDKSQNTRSPSLSSFFRFNGILPTLHRDPNPQHRHQPQHHRSHPDRDGSRNKERVKSPSKSQHEDRSRDTVKITLQDLDHRHGPYCLSVKRGLEVVRLETWVTERCHDSDRRPSDIVRVRFFADARELGRHDLAGFYPSVWFRLVPPRDDDIWSFTDLDHGHQKVDSRCADEMSRCIESGNTVGQLRMLVAKHKGVDDPNRIVIVARDGARVGSLQGDMWELRQIRSWFCRWLSVDVSPPRSYVILDGPWGQYLYHPSKDSHAAGVVTARDVKKMAETCLLNDVDRVHNSKLGIKRSHITLTSGGGRLGDYARIQLGTKVGFKLPWYLEDGLAAEESWLLPATETCTVCADDKKVTELPTQIASSCKHEPTTCRDCLGRWIHSSLDTSTWDRLKCPECPELLGFDDVRRYAPKQDFDRYDTLATRAALESIPNFRWCLSTSCESGQIHDATCTKFKCTVCRAKHCVYHNVPWHSGETCEEYDRRTRRRRKDDKASEDMIKETTKVCPECKQPVHKWTGCNHITCVCGHEWCYLCLAPFRRNQHGFLYCRHKAGCTEVDPFADVIDPQGGHPVMLEQIRNFGARRAAFRPPAFVHPPPEVHRRGQAPDHLAAWLDRLDEGLMAMLDRPAGQPVPRLGDLLEQNLNHTGIGLMDHGNNGPPGNQHRPQDHVDVWVRTWMRMEEAMMARNHHVHIPLDLPAHPD